MVKKCELNRLNVESLLAPDGLIVSEDADLVGFSCTTNSNMLTLNFRWNIQDGTVGAEDGMNKWLLSHTFILQN